MGISLKLRKKLWDILEGGGRTKAKTVFEVFIITLIILNVIAVIFRSVDSISKKYDNILYAFEGISVLVFSVEYLLRIWACTSQKEFSSSIWGRIKFAFRPMSLVDFLAIAPFYLIFFGVDLKELKLFRLFRILWLLKIARYYKSIGILERVFRAKREELLLALVLMMTILLLASSIMYYCERDAQPKLFSSIPATMWWGVTTLTTVGYGDMCPITAAGKILAGIISIVGVGTFALPTAILGAGFIEEFQKHKKPLVCPHCGKKLDEKEHQGPETEA